MNKTTENVLGILIGILLIAGFTYLSMRLGISGPSEKP